MEGYLYKFLPHPIEGERWACNLVEMIEKLHLKQVHSRIHVGKGI